SSTLPSSSSSSTFPSSSSSSSTSQSSYSSSSFPLSFSRSSSSPELRLVLLGRSGSGKSAAGNSILGQEAFQSHSDSLTSITLECEKKKALVEGRRVAVVDTPDWFNSERAPEEVRAQISSCVALSSPGPHAFLLCVPLDQPAKTELQALRALETVFGPEAVQRHALVLFTYADRLRASGKAGNESVEAYIAGQRGDLLNLVEKCRDRFHVMESGGGETERRSVAELLEKVEQTVKEAGGQCYSSPAFQEAENRVRQRQVEIAREKRGTNQEQAKSRDVGGLSTERQLYPYMQPVAEAEEEVREDEIGETRDEAEMSVSTMDIESLPPITVSSLSPSLLSSVMEKMQSSAKLIPKLLTDGSVWVGDGAKKVKGSPVWGTVGSRAQNVQKMVVDSSVWGKMGASAKQASKLLGDRVPKVVVDSSSWVGSGAKAAAASPMWGKVGSGARTGAKNLTQSPMWAKVGSGAKTGAQLVAQNSVRVGAGIGAGAKKVAQSPVWEKVGSGAKSGAKMVAASPVWEKIGTTAKQVPMVVIAGAVLGLLLGLLLGGAIGGAVGAAAGSAVTEVGRRKLGNKSTLGKTEDPAKTLERRVNDSVDSIVKQGGKVLKTE
ncbi:immune-associated nucleotide-binding protein 13, partial [Scophthalmus maximus]|uniref:immune-associated nucleotide-binding protein 13 n=1 Tax=Scophthalmus maximus TaxID=52904 RepID=UPI001FA86DF6